MSEARNQRFEIDIDEIERQLRRSVEMPAEPKTDPLAELARIVGQNDPFQGILNSAPTRGAASAVPPNPGHDLHDQQFFHADPAAPQYEPDAGRHFDPVSDVYGSRDDTLANDEYEPLPRRRSRGKLMLVGAGLVATVSAVAFGLSSFRKPGGVLSSGAPPVIVADTSPLKVAPDNPGGVDVPNQDRQIYSRDQKDGTSRVVDGREQPVDVKATTPAISARNPVSSEPGSPVNEALGDPRKVRTVAVTPSGTRYGAPATPTATGTQDPIPAAGLPAPTPVQTVAVPTQPAPAAPAPAMEASGPAAVAAAPEAAAPGRPPVSVLPPARPHFGTPDAASRTASVNPATPPKPAQTAARTEKPAAEKPTAEKPAAGNARNYAVQIAVRPTEQEARAAWDQAQDKYGATLDNKPARLTSAKVAGKTVHRVRLGPMSKQEADAMCGRLKAKGGSCFVAQN